MARNHHSYVVRCRDLGTIDERIEIEHIQSGARTVVRSLEAAIVWLQSDPDIRVSTTANTTGRGPADCWRPTDQ